MLNSARNVPALRDRIAGLVVGPADPQWDEARQPWNLAVDQRPAFVAFPETADDVVAIVEHARRNGLRVAPAGHRPQRRPARRPARHDPAQHLAHARRRDRRRGAPRPRGGRHAVARGHRARLRARPGAAGRLVARRRRRRLLPRRRRELARPQARPGRQQRARHRARHRRRPAAPRRPRQRPGPVLGAARRRRQLRRRDGDGDRPLPHARALRRRDVVAVGARVRGHARLARVDADRAGRGHLLGPHHADPADPRAPRVPARPQLRDDRRRDHRRPRVRRRDRAGAARPRARDRHLRHGAAGRPLAAARRPRGADAAS